MFPLASPGSPSSWRKRWPWRPSVHRAAPAGCPGAECPGGSLLLTAPWPAAVACICFSGSSACFCRPLLVGCTPWQPWPQRGTGTPGKVVGKRAARSVAPTLNESDQQIIMSAFSHTFWDLFSFKVVLTTMDDTIFKNYPSWPVRMPLRMTDKQFETGGLNPTSPHVPQYSSTLRSW